MEYVIYILAGITILLAIGGLSAYQAIGHIGLLLSSIVSIVCSITAIVMLSFWPLLISFLLNWGLRLAGLDPGSKGGALIAEMSHRATHNSCFIG